MFAYSTTLILKEASYDFLRASCAMHAPSAPLNLHPGIYTAVSTQSSLQNGTFDLDHESRLIEWKATSLDQLWNSPFSHVIIADMHSPTSSLSYAPFVSSLRLKSTVSASSSAKFVDFSISLDMFMILLFKPCSLYFPLQYALKSQYMEFSSREYGWRGVNSRSDGVK